MMALVCPPMFVTVCTVLVCIINEVSLPSCLRAWYHLSPMTAYDRI